MSGNIELIRYETHGNKAWKRFEDYRFALGTTVVPISAQEVSKAALSMPLAFTQASGSISLVAVCGLLPDQNLFIAPDGRWAGSYVPAVFRGYPFKLARSDADTFSLCIDTSSGLLVAREQGEPLFNEDGKPSEVVSKVMEFLFQVSKGLEAVRKAATALWEAGALEPWPITIRDGDREKSVTGLLRVNEQALSGLDDQAFLALRKVGALQLAYAQLLSSGNIGHLPKLSQLRGEVQKLQQEADNAKHQQLLQPNGSDSNVIDWSRIFNS